MVKYEEEGDQNCIVALLEGQSSPPHSLGIMSHVHVDGSGAAIILPPGVREWSKSNTSSSFMCMLSDISSTHSPIDIFAAGKSPPSASAIMALLRKEAKKSQK